MSWPRRPWMLPLVPLYAAGAALRWAGVRQQKLAWPVISVGNLSAGGTGKTPFVIALARLLDREGVHADVLTRGYGRSKSSSAEVVPDGTADLFGDEPLLIARQAGIPVFVGGQRYEAGWLAEAVAKERGNAAGVHLLDDGFQHRQLAREIDIVLVNAEDLQDHLLPAGNLREGLGALRRATVFAVSAEDEEAIGRLRAMRLAQPVWRFRRVMSRPPELVSMALNREPVAAFCGIARPRQFFEGLQAAGLRVAGSHAFRDHHRFTGSDVELLRRLAVKAEAGVLVTTRKDQIRLGSLEAEIARAAPLVVVDLKIELENEAEIAAWIESRLSL